MHNSENLYAKVPADAALQLTIPMSIPSIAVDLPAKSAGTIGSPKFIAIYAPRTGKSVRVGLHTAKDLTLEAMDGWFHVHILHPICR